MRRYWIDREQFHFKSQEPVLGHVEIRDEVFHHIVDVCRQEMGSRFEVLGWDDLAFLTEITELKKKHAIATIISSRKLPPLPKPNIHIALCMPRFPVMDAVIERSVELGIKSIQPLVSDFSFVKKDIKLVTQKSERWSKIVISATQQSGRSDRMQIRPVANLIDWSKNLMSESQNKPTHFVFAFEGEGGQSLRENIRSISNPKTLEDVWLVIGGEGGFSAPEVQQLTELGLRPVTLGEQVLRVETACLALASILKYELQL